MKKLILLVLGIILWNSPAFATDVGDIYYSDKTFSTNLNTSKMPIGRCLLDQSGPNQMLCSGPAAAGFHGAHQRHHPMCQLQHAWYFCRKLVDSDHETGFPNAYPTVVGRFR